MAKNSFNYVFKTFVLWRVLLLIIVFTAVYLIKLQPDFLGGGAANYQINPYVWSWANFDGEHYLAIAQQGYSPLRYFFFPVYPMLIKVLAFGSKNLYTLLLSALGISNLSLIIGLMGLIKLIQLDYKENMGKMVVVVLLLFPTSFYLGSVYTESLFFTLSVWSLYFARKGKWLTSGLLGAILTATRIVGLAIIPALTIEMLQQKKWKFKEINLYDWFTVLLPLLGLLLYMLYLNKVTGDPLDFFHNVSIYGQQRSAGFVLLPQVFYRYVFKILTSVNYDYFPVVFTTWLEFVTASAFGLLLGLSCLEWIGRKWESKRLVGLRKYEIRDSYLVYAIVGYIIPTLSGSFSSLPRYVLVLFPVFILIANLLNKQKNTLKYLYYLVSVLGLAVACSLFVRGYWVA